MTTNRNDAASCRAAKGTTIARQALPRLWRDQRGVAAVMVAVFLLPVMGMLALAIDFSAAVTAKSQIEIAADAAILAATRAASTAYAANESNYISLGQQAGLARFNAQTGSIGRVTTPTIAISLALSGTSIVGSASWSATYTTILGKLMGVTSWPMAGTVGSIAKPGVMYLDVEIIIDNSGSMEIGATTADIATLQQITPCAVTGAMVSLSGGDYGRAASNQLYSAYQCTWGGNTYDGSLTCPVPATSPYTFSTFVPSASFGSHSPGPSCQGWLPKQTSGPGAGTYPSAGPPCGFACHWDQSAAAGTGADFFALARSTIGQSNQVTLRFDVVKAAVRALISTMQSYSTTLNNMQVGVFTFDTALTQIYPTNPASGPAGNDWIAALAAVGAAPTSPNQADTGIQPYGGPDGAATDFEDSMQVLYSNYLTAGGSGLTAASPRKVLFLLTDGLDDYVDGGGSRILGAIDPSYCQLFKNRGYTIYVIYTPYDPLMNYFYLEQSSGLVDTVEGSGSTSITTNLQACASSPEDFIMAGDSSSIQAAFLTFLKAAASSKTYITQ